MVTASLLVPEPSHRVVTTWAGNDPRWDEYVSTHPSGTGFLQSRWLRALQREVHTCQCHLACENEAGQLVGILPLVQTRGLPGAGQLSAARWASLPRTPVGGPLADTPRAAAALVAAAVEMAEHDGRLLQLKRDTPDLDDLVPGLVGVPWRTSYVVPLAVSNDEVGFGSSRNQARLRTAVRRARRAGLRFREGSRADLDQWYLLYLETMRFHGVPARRRRFFHELLAPGGPAQLVMIERDTRGAREALAGAVVVRAAETVSYAFNGARRDTFELRPNELMQWEAIASARRDGYRWYDLGEVSSGNEGLRQFKRKWGSESRQLWHYYRPARIVQEDDEFMDGRVGELARGAWRRVPLRATAVVGGIVNDRL